MSKVYIRQVYEGRMGIIWKYLEITNVYTTSTKKIERKKENIEKFIILNEHVQRNYILILYLYSVHLPT